MIVLAVLLAGMLHGLGADHLAAVSIMKAAGNSLKLTKLCAQFALGHIGILVPAALAARIGIFLLPAWVESLLDMAGGCVLIATGCVFLIWSSTASRVKTKWAATTGSLFALSGIRSLLTIVPILTSGSFLQCLFRALAFALGIFLIMMAWGVIGDKITSRLTRGSELKLASCLAILAGMWVIYEHSK